MSPFAARMARAKGKSNELPSLRKSAGAMFTVMSAWGNL